MSKVTFEIGYGGILLDELMSMCMVTGWMNETIGSYTCTQDCQPPTNYSEVFTYDWTPSFGSLKYTVVEYKCNNPAKKIVNLVDDTDTNLVDSLNVSCLFNGRWDTDVTEFGCTGNSTSRNGKPLCIDFGRM